jgi:ferredoxin
MTKKYQFELEPSTCIFCAACASVAPGHFFIDADDEKAQVTKQPENPTELASCRAAMINCPTSSIVESERR